MEMGQGMWYTEGKGRHLSHIQKTIKMKMVYNGQKGEETQGHCAVK